jgi:hypothetical protein
MQQQTPAVGELIIIGVVLALVVVCYIIPFWRICSKAGYSGALALLMFVPLANIVLLFFLAFSKWPIERRLEQAQPGVQSS